MLVAAYIEGRPPAMRLIAVANTMRLPDGGIRTFLVLDLGLDIVDSVAALHLERDRLPRQGLDEDLHLFFSSPIDQLLPHLFDLMIVSPLTGLYL